MLFADSLANYDTLLKIRPQTYIWGHIFIIVCALYGVFIYLPKLMKSDLIKAICFVSVMAVCAIICNSLFRVLLNWEPNYFYLYNYKGTPLKFLYNVCEMSTYGWFSINWFYTLTLLIVFIGVFIGMYMFNLGIKATVSENMPIDKLIDGMLISMSTSFLGLLLTTINNAIAGNVRKKVDEDKGEFYAFLQNELLPHLGTSVVATLNSLRNTINLFEPAFKNVISDFETTFTECTQCMPRQRALKLKFSTSTKPSSAA